MNTDTRTLVETEKGILLNENWRCLCGELLLWRDEGRYYKSICACGRWAWTIKQKVRLFCFIPNCNSPECDREHMEEI